MNIIDLIAETEDGESKTAMIRALGVYMRQQYLIWNKDTVSDETILQDIVRLSDNRIQIPEGLQLTKSEAGNAQSRQGNGQHRSGRNQWQKNNQKMRKQRK